MPPGPCHHFKGSTNPPTDFVRHAAEIEAVGRAVFGGDVQVTVRYGVAPFVLIAVENRRDDLPPLPGDKLARFVRALTTDELRTFVHDENTYYTPRGRNELEPLPTTPPTTGSSTALGEPTGPGAT